VELRKLKTELAERNKTENGHKLQVLEEQKWRAEDEKEAAISALEVRSKEYIWEREEKKKLEEKIRMMN
jgi:hypothetical protein